MHEEAETEVYVRLCRWLAEEGAEGREVVHAATRTSEESAAARGEPLAVGGKALLLRCGEEDFQLFVFSAARRLDSSAIRRAFGIRHLRFATAEELLARTGLVPGSVPPFGAPVLPFALNLDPSVLAQDRIAFNAGMLTRSRIVPISTYERLARPARCFSFTTAG